MFLSLLAEIYFTNASLSSRNIRVGLLFNDRNWYLNYHIFKPSCDIAIEKINNQSHLFNSISLSYVWRPTTHFCGNPVMTAPGIATKMYYDHKLLALIGPPCSGEMRPIADLANFWNIPILSGTAGASYLNDKSRYRTLTRTSFNLSTLGNFLVSIFKTFRWTAASIIWENKTAAFWKLLLDAISGSLKHAGAEINDVLLQDHPNSSEALIAAKRRGRSKFSF